MDHTNNDRFCTNQKLRKISTFLIDKTRTYYFWNNIIVKKNNLDLFFSLFTSVVFLNRALPFFLVVSSLFRK